MNACSICKELANTNDSRFSTIFSASGIHNAIMAKTEEFSIIPSIGPLVYGHCLITTRNHCSSLLSRIEAEETEQQLQFLLHKILGTFGAKEEKVLLCFEHGASDCFNRELCSTTHAHLHTVPLSRLLANKIFQEEKCEFESSSISDIALLSKKMSEYLAYFIFDRQKLYKVKVYNAEKLSSQYFRKVICNYIGSSHWDWKEYPNKNIIEDTIKNGFQFNVNVSIQNRLFVAK